MFCINGVENIVYYKSMTLILRVFEAAYGSRYCKIGYL